MPTPYKRARNASDMQVEPAAKLLGVEKRTLLRYESDTDKSDPPPDIVYKMSQIYRAPWLLAAHCKQKCDIGRHLGYELLNNINLDPVYVLGKLREELQEAVEATDKLLSRVITRQGRWSDFSEAEKRDNTKDLHELLDAEHNIEVLKMVLGAWVDMPGEIRRHNDKCYLHGYAVTKGQVPDYVMAVAETAASYNP